MYVSRRLVGLNKHFLQTSSRCVSSIDTSPSKPVEKSGKVWSQIDNKSYGILAASLAALGASTSVTMYIPKQIGRLLDFSTNPALHDQIWPLMEWTGGVITAGALANFCRIYLQKSAVENILKSMRHKTYTSLVDKSQTYYEKKKLTSTEAVSRLNEDIRMISEVIGEETGQVLRSLLVLSIGFYNAYTISPYLVGQAAIAIPAIIGTSAVLGRINKKIVQEKQKSTAETSKFVNESLGNLTTVKIFEKENYEISRYNQLIRSLKNLGIKSGKYEALMFAFNGFSGNVAIMYLLYIAAELVKTGDLTVGALTSFSLYCTWMGISVGSLAKSYSA